jgi:tRNA-specific 2-thiouridylase
MSPRIIVGMSGGVDSSIAAFILKTQGFDVEGVSFTLYEARMRRGLSKTPCCSMEVVNDAKKTAEIIGIRHSVIDLRDEFIEKVIEPFAASYAKGVTPNPCILCNKYIKFPYLLKLANNEIADFIATGHYANVERTGDVFSLTKGVDPKKDQSYVLYCLTEETLKRLILPLGKNTKSETRELAKKLNLPAINRSESQEICFIDEMGYHNFIGGIIEPKTGAVIDAETGKVLGVHKGIHLFTIGQRKRIGFATGKPSYVTKIDTEQNAVYIGTKAMAMCGQIKVSDINWLISKKGAFRATVKIRSMMRDEPAMIEAIDKDTVRITFDMPQWAPAPGQSAVFYEDNTVIGGGIIVDSE